MIRQPPIAAQPLARMPQAARDAVLAELTAAERDHVGRMWELWARPEQLPPPGDWRLWLICAGRGFGKTRAGAEWVRHVAHGDPDARIALVGASLAEVRAVMVEGESGVLSVCHPEFQPEYEPSLRRITWPNGAQAFLYSAAEPESLRGPQHSHARRPGAEGIHGQRSRLAVRQPAPWRDRRGSNSSAAHARKWRMLAGRRVSRRKLVRAGRQDRLLAGRKLALHRSARRAAPARSIERPDAVLSRRLERARSASVTQWRSHD